MSRAKLWRQVRLAVSAGDKAEAEAACRRLGWTKADTIRKLLDSIHKQEAKRRGPFRDQ